MDTHYEITEIKEEYIEESELDHAAEEEEATTFGSNKANGNVLSPFNIDIKLKMLSGEYKLSTKRKRSRVWECFARILNENDEEIDDFVICRKCHNIYKFFQKSTSNLVRHKCYIKYYLNDPGCGEKIDVNIDTKMEGIQIFSQWIIENGRSATIIEDSGFKKIAQFLISIGAEYGRNVNIEELIPHPTAMCKNVDELYTTYYGYVKAEIKQIKSFGFALSSDIFTDNYLRKSYISLTIHYIHEGNIVARLLGLKSLEEEKCSGENIAHKTCEILKDFDCNLDDNVIMVSNRNTNMIAAFPTNKHISCINHLLHNVLHRAIHDDEDVTKLYRSCIKLVKYLKISSINETLCTTLKNLAPTRWNNLYYLFATIKQNWTEIVQFLQGRNNFGIISDISITHVTAIIKLLQLFEEASKKLEGENYATIHFAYVYVHRLQKSCIVESTDSNIIKQFKTKLANNLQTFAVPSLTIFHKIALYLFPPTKKLLLFKDDEKEAIKKECKNIMSCYIRNEKEACNAKSMPTAVSKKTLELFSDFVQVNEMPKVEDKIDKEMHNYENTSVHFYDDFNVIKWWESHKEEFPLLYRMSCMVLATPASSAASEKVFSVARNLIFEKRCMLSLDKSSINKIMFLHSNMDKFD